MLEDVKHEVVSFFDPFATIIANEVRFFGDLGRLATEAKTFFGFFLFVGPNDLFGVNLELKIIHKSFNFYHNYSNLPFPHAANKPSVPLYSPHKFSHKTDKPRNSHPDFPGKLPQYALPSHVYSSDTQLSARDKHWYKSDKKIYRNRRLVVLEDAASYALSDYFLTCRIFHNDRKCVRFRPGFWIFCHGNRYGARPPFAL
jgi:hypothetical protein